MPPIFLTRGLAMAIDIDYVLMYGGYYNKVTGAGPYAADDSGNMTLIGAGGGGGSGGGSVSVSNWPAVQDVSVTQAVWRKLPVEIDYSGSILAADTWQVVVPLDPNRIDFSLQLITDDVELWLTTHWEEGLQAGDPKTWRLQTGNTYWAKGCNEIRVLSSSVGAVYTASGA